jgi:hypothetical protein
MNLNFVGSIYGRSSIVIAHIVPIRLQTWPPQAILVSDWLISKKIFFSETAFPNELKFTRQGHRASGFWHRLFGKVVSEKKNFRNRPIRNKNCLW